MTDPFDVVCVASWNADLISRITRPLARGETLLASHFEIGPGGKGSNAAVACARQGARVALIARIGADDFGRMALDLWRREGLHAEHVEQAADERSGVAQILVYDDGDNSIAVAPGAGSSLGAAQVEAARAVIIGARVVMACNEVPVAATLAAFRLARAAGVTTLLNPAPARELPAELARELLRLTDVITPNQTELAVLAGGAVDTHSAATVLLGRGVGAVLVTLGVNGCCLYRSGHPALPLAGWPMSVADTIGAGDTFTGALAARLACGDDITNAMRHANAAAALSVTGRGAIDGMPSLAQVLAMLRRSRHHNAAARAQ
jgi:ribokinase